MLRISHSKAFFYDKLRGYQTGQRCMCLPPFPAPTGLPELEKGGCGVCASSTHGTDPLATPLGRGMANWDSRHHTTQAGLSRTKSNLLLWHACTEFQATTGALRGLRPNIPTMMRAGFREVGQNLRNSGCRWPKQPLNPKPTLNPEP